MVRQGEPRLGEHGLVGVSVRSNELGVGEFAVGVRRFARAEVVVLAFGLFQGLQILVPGPLVGVCARRRVPVPIVFDGLPLQRDLSLFLLCPDIWLQVPVVHP